MLGGSVSRYHKGTSENQQDHRDTESGENIRKIGFSVIPVSLW